MSEKHYSRNGLSVTEAAALIIDAQRAAKIEAALEDDSEVEGPDSDPDADSGPGTDKPFTEGQ
jgi:hypothetical protein